MDADTPGFQSNIKVSRCTQTVQNISIWVIDPLGSRAMYSIGFIGGIDRGIAFGHAPDNGNFGAVAAVTGTPVIPVHPNNNAFIWPQGGIQQAFAGAEVQYIELGSGQAAIISAQPSGPAFTVNVSLVQPAVGDVFRFYLFDVVAAAFSGGAFSTQAPVNSLDSGGDVVPDGTPAVSGIDSDPPAPVPPASFYVDYIDGPVTGGGATITIEPVLGDANGDCAVNVDDLIAVIVNWGPCPTPPATCPADLDGTGIVDVDDLIMVILNWS
jgi:hypothetical protein